MATIRPNAEPAVTAVQAGDIFLIDGATGVRALAASKVPVRDANANVAINNVVEGYATTATAAGTTTLDVTSARQQFFTGTTTQTVLLPVTSTLAQGQLFFFNNNSTGVVTVQSSGANNVVAIAPGAAAVVECVSLTGTTAASWDVNYFGSLVASGKALTVSNSLTLAGVDGKTLTVNTNGTLGGGDAWTLGIAAGKTFAVSNSLTLAGIDSTTLTFQGTDTYVGRATTDILTNKTFDTAGTGNVFKINGTQITSNTGTGANVLATNPAIVGTATNDNATAGNYGEYVESVIATGSATSLTNATPKNITSISLTAGDWDVSGSVEYNGAGSVSITYLAAGVSTTTGTLDQTNGRTASLSMAAVVPGTSPGFGLPVGPVRLSLSGTTTIYLVSNQAFTVGTLAGFGLLRARRVR